MYWVGGLLLINYNRQVEKCLPTKKKQQSSLIKLTMTIEKTLLQSSIMMVINDSDKQFQKFNFRKLPSYKMY